MVAPMNPNQPTGEPGEQPAPDQVTAQAEESVQPFGESDIARAIESMDQESLMAMLDGNPLPDQPAPTVEPTDPNPTPQDAGESQPSEEPVEDHPQPHSDEGTATTLKRMSLRGLPEDQAAQMVAAKNAVKDGLVPDLATYFRQISGETPAPVTEQAQPQEEPPPEPAPLVSDLQSQLTTLREQRKQAKLDYDTEAESALTDQIEDTLLAIQTARFEEVSTAAQVATYQQTHEQAIEMVEAKYGDLLDNEASPFGRLLSQSVLAAKATNDPALQDPNFIVKFADQLARDLGINGTTKAAPRAAATPPQGPPARASRPVGSTMAPGHSKAPSYTPDQINQLIATASFDDLLAVLEPG